MMAALAAKITSVRQSTIAARPSCQATTAINANELTTTASSTAAASGERRSFGINGPLQATSKNPGRR